MKLYKMPDGIVRQFKVAPKGAVELRAKTEQIEIEEKAVKPKNKAKRVKNK